MARQLEKIKFFIENSEPVEIFLSEGFKVEETETEYIVTGTTRYKTESKHTPGQHQSHSRDMEFRVFKDVVVGIQKTYRA